MLYNNDSELMYPALKGLGGLAGLGCGDKKGCGCGCKGESKKSNFSLMGLGDIPVNCGWWDLPGSRCWDYKHNPPVPMPVAPLPPPLNNSGRTDVTIEDVISGTQQQQEQAWGDFFGGIQSDPIASAYGSASGAVSSLNPFNGGGFGMLTLVVLGIAGVVLVGEMRH